MRSTDRRAIEEKIAARTHELKSLLKIAGGDAAMSETGGWDRQTIERQTADPLVVERALTELRHLNASMRRLQSDSACYCEECGREIPPARILALPTARTCVECARGH